MNKLSIKKKIIIILAILLFVIGVVIGFTIKHNQVSKGVQSGVDVGQSVQDKVKKDTIEANSDDIKEAYTEEYKKYMELNNEEKNEKGVIPRKYTVKYDDLQRIIEKEAKNSRNHSNNNETTDNNNNNDKNETTNSNNDNINQENQNKKNEDNKDGNNKTDLKELPSSFDLRNHIKLKVKDQIFSGRCWIFASLECVETNLALTQGKYYDFSEAHVDYLTSNLLSKNYREPQSGGNFNMFVEYYINRQDGFVDENKMFYLGDYSKCGEALLDMEKINESVYDIAEFPEYNPNYSDWTEEQFKEYQNTIKYHIMNYGSLYASVYSFPNEKYPNVYFKDEYDNNSDDGGHAISIIGWDDNYSRNNFKSPNGNVPEKDGAYIFLNSWGEDYGEKGYGYISYCDSQVHSDLNGVISTNKKDLVNINQLSEAAQKYIYKDLKNNLIDNNYIKKSVLESVRTIDLSNQNLTQVKGLNVFPNLEELNISNNKITDISNLSKLKNLYSIDFSGNKNITGWKDLSNVSTIVAKNCDIKDLSGIENMSELACLDLSGNTQLTNLELINKVQSLCSLSLENCNLNNISFINNPTIVNLNISNNKNISDYSELAKKYEYLDELKLKNNGITDISKLNISNIIISTIDLSDNPNLSNFDKLPKVSKLVLSNCELNDVECIKEMDNISELDISYNNIKDISPINSMTYLYYLNVAGNKDIKGNLEDTDINELNINDCNLDNNFDYFKINSLSTISCKNNNIKLNTVASKNENLYKIIMDKCTYEDYYNLRNGRDLCIEDTTVYKTTKIPSGNVRIYINNAAQYISKKDFIKNVKSDYIDIELSKNAQIEMNNYTDNEDEIYNCKFVYSFEVDNNITPIAIQVKQLPNKMNYTQDDKLKFDGLKVSLVYDNNKIFKEIKDYNVEIPDEMLYDMYNIKVYKDNLEACFPIFYKKEQVELKFDNKKVYNFIYTKLQEGDSNNHDIIKDDKKMVIKVNGEIYKNFLTKDLSIDIATLSDMDTIKDIKITTIMIEDYNGNTDEIDREKIKRVFPYVNFAYTFVDNEDIILIDDGEFVYKNN